MQIRHTVRPLIYGTPRRLPLLARAVVLLAAMAMLSFATVSAWECPFPSGHRGSFSSALLHRRPRLALHGEGPPGCTPEHRPLPPPPGALARLR